MALRNKKRFLVYLSLGSNLGDRKRNILFTNRILDMAPYLEVIARSSIIETKPVDYEKQFYFFNQVIAIKTYLLPYELLRYLKAFEWYINNRFCPSFKKVSKLPRYIDIDILFYMEPNISIVSSYITVPHKELANRVFLWKLIDEISKNLLRGGMEGVSYNL
jgi:2-amino-4-hydroxy-6-hydroxymethyldihydropteridine diphosphokinase